MLAAAALAAAAGCGGSPAGPPTTTAPEGAVVSAERYLADSVAAAAAAREFAAVLAPLGPSLGAPELRRVVPRLKAALTRATLAGQRLGAERLEDRRLEEQRGRVATLYERVVAAMGAVLDAANRGDASDAAEAAADLDAALEALRGIGATTA